MTQYIELFAALAARFRSSEVKSRKQSGRDLQYVTARTVMNRLDETLGPENWWDRYTAREHSVECRLTIRLPDGTKITKCDVGGNAGMSDEGDDDKSGYSDAFKRAAVKFGVGRYLYGDGVPAFASIAQTPAAVATPVPVPVPANGNGHHTKARGIWGNPKAPATPAPTVDHTPIAGEPLPASPAQVKAIRGLAARHKVDTVDVCDRFSVEALEDLSVQQAAEAIKRFNSMSVRK